VVVVGMPMVVLALRVLVLLVAVLVEFTAQQLVAQERLMVQMEQQIQAVVLAVAVMLVQTPQAALASSLFVTLQHNQHQLQQQATHKSTTLTATKSTLGHHLEL
jgi:hypothetical protein